MPASRRASGSAASGALDPGAWLPSPKVLLWMLLAFVAGLLLFAVVWLTGRENPGAAEPRVPAAAAVDDGQVPLPAPAPARTGERRIRGPAPADAPAEPPQARLVESPAPPPPTAPAAPPPEDAPPPVAGVQASPQPIPGQTPAPDYPARALRRGESGTVTIRAEIGADGVPTAVSVEQSSGSRALDRAAADAVSRWRFQPALRDGRPTSGSVVVPISFDPR